MEPKRILIVEDEILIRMFMKKQLQSNGLEIVAETGNSEDAIYLAKETKPDLIFMDVRIHGNCDGVETARLIQEVHKVPVAFVTAYDTLREGDLNKLEHVGIFQKPLSQHSIEEILRAAG